MSNYYKTIILKKKCLRNAFLKSLRFDFPLKSLKQSNNIEECVDENEIKSNVYTDLYKYLYLSPVFSGVSVAQSLVLCVVYIIVCLFVFFPLAIILYVIL